MGREEERKTGGSKGGLTSEQMVGKSVAVQTGLIELVVGGQRGSDKKIGMVGDGGRVEQLLAAGGGLEKER
ncbi:MAG: hypothetical protein D6722_15865 [Bacteroidetes bacterium]|nr:MAG: hypothetical protein D6722_15865 [Bacteroidota bacterium]